MIRFSAVLVAGAIAVLVVGVLATSLALVYLSIGVSVLASVLLVIGVVLQRREIFGETGAAATTGQPVWPVTPATGTPVMVGGRARIPEPSAIPEPGARPAEAEGRAAEAGAGSGNGSSGPPPGRDAVAEIRWVLPEPEGSPESGPARASQGKNGPGRNGPGEDGPANGGAPRAGRMGGYSGTHGSGRGRPPTAPPGRRAPAAPPVGPGPRGAGEPAAYGGATDSGPGIRPDQGTRPDQGSHPDQRAAGTAPPGHSAGPPGHSAGPPGHSAGPPARPRAGAGPPEWPGPDIIWQEPADARRTPREPDSGWVFTPPTPPDLPATPAEEPDAPAPAAKGPAVPAPAAEGLDGSIPPQEPAVPPPAAERLDGSIPPQEPAVPPPAAEGPDASITSQGPAHDQRPARETEDGAGAPPTRPERPLSPAEPDHPALPHDDFWNRLNEELAADGESEPDGPSRAASAGPRPPAASAGPPPPAASAGPPPPAAAGDPWSRPADRRSDEVSGAGNAGPDRSATSEQWSAWAPSVFSRPGSPSARDEDEPRDRADEGAAGKEAKAGTSGPLLAWRDAAADHLSSRDAEADHADTGVTGKEAAAAGKEAGDSEKEAGAKAEEPDEDEEAAPSPWSIPLTLVDDLSDLDEEDGGQSADARDHGIKKPPAAWEKPAPERTGSDVWTRPSWASTKETRAGSTQADVGSGPEKPHEADWAGAGAGLGPWLTRPGKGTTAGWDSGDAAATRAGDKTDAADAKADADYDATPGKTAQGAGALPRRAGRDDPSIGADRDEVAARMGGEPGAGDHAKATPADRDDSTTRAGRDDADVHPGRDDADVRAGRDDGADDQAKATGAGQEDGDAASRVRADTDAAAAASTSAESAGSASAASAGSASAASAGSASAASAGSASAASAGPASAASADLAPAPGEAGPRTDSEAKPPSGTPAESATPAGRPSATLFEPASRATPGSFPDPVTTKTPGPGAQPEAPKAAEEAGGQRAPEAESGIGAGQNGPAPAGARDDDERGTAEKGGTGKTGPAADGTGETAPATDGTGKTGPATAGNAVVIVPGVARYHRTGCILIRFLGGDDLQTLTAQEAQAKGCAPCRACEPDKPLSSGD